MPDTQTFERYLQFIRQDSRYQNVRDLYTETEALIPLEAEKIERKSEHPEHDVEPAQKKVERFPVLAGLHKYALGRDRQHVLLAGRPGSGKSTTLKRLLLELADKRIAEFIAIPVYAQLKSDRAILDLISTEFRRAKIRVTPEQLDDWLLQDQLLLLLDGVNEIPSDERRRQLQDFREDNPSTPMIFTTRDLSVGGDLGIDQQLEMCLLSEPQMQEFVGKYLTHRGMPDQADILIWQLRDRLREIAKTPLLLKMLCDVFDPVTRQIPQSKGELFQQFDRDYERIKKDRQPVPVSENFWEFKADILQFLAFSMIQTDDPKSVEAWYALSSDRAERLLETWLNSRDVSDPATKAKLWLKDLRRCHLLQDAKDPGEIEFHHQLFQEYYAAEYLLRLLTELSDKQLKRDYLNLLKWTEPIALMLALVDEEDQALRVVELAIDNVDLMLGAKLVGEVKIEFQEKTIELINRLVVPEQVKVELLGRTGSEKATPELVRVLSSQDISVVEIAASYVGETNDQMVLRQAQKRLEDISDTFLTQTSFGGSDNTGDLWTSHVQVLAYLAPQKTIGFLRKKIESQGTILNLVTQGPQILMRLDEKKLVPELLERLHKSQSEAEKNHILNLIGYSTEYALIIPKLIEVLEKEESEFIRKQILGILGESQDQLAIDTLIDLIERDNSRLRTEAAKQLVKIKKLKNLISVEKLCVLLKHDDWQISWHAAIVLGHLGYKMILERMLHELKNHDSARIRMWAARVLGMVADESCIPCLLHSLKNDPETQVRMEAAFSLSSFGEPEAISTLISALNFGHIHQLLSSIRSLAKFNFQELLLQIMISKSPGWETASVELGKLRRTEAAEVLFDALAKPIYEPTGMIIDLLAELANIALIRTLVTALENPDVYDSDIYFQNRIAFTLVKSNSEYTATQLKTLTDIMEHKYIPQLFWVIPTIQSRCKFYNYEIFYGIVPEGKTISLYLSYAPADEALQTQLANHLTLLEREEIITSWSQHRILPGDEPAQVINQKLNTADIILLLISANSLADDTCYHLEIQRAIERHQASEARVIPILLRPVDWAGASFNQLDLLPKNHQPVISWNNQDEAFQEIAEDIRAVAMEVRRKKREG
ncbi:MAG: TIR domain-containing protein [Leptolyngbya sp. SIO1D8]|nr:TIR domain-containing protein [Leptolyngbya sp. SIO1D8]